MLLVAVLAYLQFLYPGQRDRREAKKHLHQAYLTLSHVSNPAIAPGKQTREQQLVTEPSGSAILVVTVAEKMVHWTARVGGYQIEADFDIAPVIGFVQVRIIEARNLVENAKLLHPELGKPLDSALLDVHNRVLLAFPSKLDGFTKLEECSSKANDAVREFLGKVSAIFQEAGLASELPTIGNQAGTSATR